MRIRSRHWKAENKDCSTRRCAITGGLGWIYPKDRRDTVEKLRKELTALETDFEKKMSRRRKSR